MITLMTVYDGTRQASLPLEWKLHDALALEELHDHVEFFTQGFISSALAVSPAVNALVPSSSVSSTERHRIERTLYRFELYCNLFQKRMRKRRELSRNRLNLEERFNDLEQRKVFFDRFPPMGE